MQDEFEVVVFDFSPTGKITVQTKGFRGPACINAVRDIEEGLGEITHLKHTAEYHQSPTLEMTQKDVVRRKR